MIIDKKIVSLLSIFILMVTVLSGCLGGPKHNNEEYKNIIKNERPVAVIDAPEHAYIGDEITFDASKSYDPDGTIVSYYWAFGDDSTAQGEVVKHVYNTKDMMTAQEYPLFVPVTLTVEDDKGAFDWLTFSISLMPKSYVFYLLEGSLSMDKPSEGSTAIKANLGLIRPKIEIIYRLDNPIVIPTCTWNVTIYMEKTRFSMLSGLSVIALGENDTEIASLNSVGSLLGNIGKTSVTYTLSGTFSENILYGIKIVVKGFSVRSSIKIISGGEKASNIYFDLT